jgi:lysophospholipase L1-like esterase
MNASTQAENAQRIVFRVTGFYVPGPTFMEAKPLTLNPGATLLFEGDSLTRFPGQPSFETWPWMRLTNAHYGYPEKVGDWIFCHRPDLNIACRVGAAGGSIMADVVGRLSSMTEAIKPDVVVMTIGINDANRAVPLADFRAQAEEYCRRLRDLCGGKVIYLGNASFARDESAAAVANAEKSKTYSIAMTEVVEAYGGLAVDLGAVLRSKSASLIKLYPGHTIYHDGTHFNMVGNEIAAGVVLRALGLMTTPGDPAGTLLKIER